MCMYSKHAEYRRHYVIIGSALTPHSAQQSPQFVIQTLTLWYLSDDNPSSAWRKIQKILTHFLNWFWHIGWHSCFWNELSYKLLLIDSSSTLLSLYKWLKTMIELSSSAQLGQSLIHFKYNYMATSYSIIPLLFFQERTHDSVSSLVPAPQLSQTTKRQNINRIASLVLCSISIQDLQFQPSY